jgi:hypothetical protein
MRSKKGGALYDNVIYIVLLVLFLAIVFPFVQAQRQGASHWEEFYCQEISKIINFAEPGDLITLDVHDATVIAQKNGVSNFERDSFRFDSERREVCVSLSFGRKTCYSYFNNVGIVGERIELGVSSSEGNLLIFRVVELESDEEKEDEGENGID